MKQSRLFTALDEGLSLDGPLHVIRPPAGYDLAGLRDVSVEATFYPDHQYWAAAGLIGDGAGRAATLVVVPRSKTLARAMISGAIAQGGTVIVDGQKTDGVESLYKDIRKVATIEGVVTKGHGRLFWFRADRQPAWEVSVTSPQGFTTVPGIFSEAKVDAGSALLAPFLDGLEGEVADLGAGWGYLSRAILQNDAVTRLDMVEAEKTALDCAVQNVDDPRAHGIWGDALTHQGAYDAVVSNPPFHTSRSGDPDLGRGFIATAARILKPRGVFFMVANRHLPYEADLDARFARIEELSGSGAFKLFRATRPKR
ncbi:class I SAM-dependent methyltransferase [Thalassorhabdomicrobium marinisediminis]|uniref:Class I SAM-dependent methyltransferase n=1 Tax=Thalassorhabdomicrobium marinisediminis TaxID=2170577 RepID=A0A2T7FYM4_9RHOB|nr:methyltransferase [Thalassorhabdomicrobium marinisediminis]PVA07269.1 class I SAM-dependent methyltransferase [Thalassorhabdomicrobium marinisediminis]